MTNRIILEYRFTFHQKLMILIVIALFLLVVVSLFTQIFTESVLIHRVIFGTCYILLIIIAFSRRGFEVNHGQLFKAYFFMGFLIYKKSLDLSRTPKHSILKFNKSRKLPWFSIAQPDAAVDYNSFEVNILNDKHTKREIIMELKKKENVKPTLDFLISHCDLKYESYSPQTRRRPNRRR